MNYKDLKGGEKMEELVLNEQQIIVTQGSIVFNDYERIKQQAAALAEKIKTVEVNEENIKQSKKLLAAVNKRIKDLEDRRIDIKKTMLAPYQEFESQVKEIIGIIKEADEEVRQQVKQLEEWERQIKHEKLEAIFAKRIVHYSFADLFSFQDFLQPKHLNKTAAIEATEKEMVDYLEKIDKDLKVINAMPKAAAILGAYMSLKDLAAAIAHVQEKEALERKIEASEVVKKSDRTNKGHQIMIFGDKDFKLTLMLLKENHISFEILS